MRKAKTIERNIDGITYTLGEVDYPRIEQGDLFHLGGVIMKCTGRRLDIIESVFMGISSSAENTLCRKVISQHAQ